MIKPGHYFATIKETQLLLERGPWRLVEIVFHLPHGEILSTRLAGKRLDRVYRELLGTQDALHQDINSLVDKECVICYGVIRGTKTMADTFYINEVHSTEGFIKTKR